MQRCALLQAGAQIALLAAFECQQWVDSITNPFASKRNKARSKTKLCNAVKNLKSELGRVIAFEVTLDCSGVRWRPAQPGEG